MTEPTYETPENMKMQALLERIASLTAEYENKIADLRVSYTVLTRELEECRAQARTEAAPSE